MVLRGLFLQVFLHQITTLLRAEFPCLSFFFKLFYIKPQQFVKGYHDADSCFFKLFYIKPQQISFSTTAPTVVSSSYSTSNLNFAIIV